MEVASGKLYIMNIKVLMIHEFDYLYIVTKVVNIKYIEKFCTKIK